MTLRLKDVNLIGCGSTLFPAAKEFNVPEDIMHTILSSIYIQLDAVNPKNKDVLNQEIIPVLKDTGLICMCAEEALAEGLLVKTSEGYALTKKAFAIFEKAAENQKELLTRNFF